MNNVAEKSTINEHIKNIYAEEDSSVRLENCKEQNTESLIVFPLLKNKFLTFS